MSAWLRTWIACGLFLIAVLVVAGLLTRALWYVALGWVTP